MKTIKKYFKAILCLMAFAVASIMFAFSPVLTGYATISYLGGTYQQKIDAIKLPTRVVDRTKSTNNILKIPFLNNTFGSGYTIRVYDTVGEPHDYVYGNAGSSDMDFFKDEEDSTPLTYLTLKNYRSGDYKIVYIVKDGTKEYCSQPQIVTVKNVQYKLDFTNSDGSKMLVPTAAKHGDRIEIVLPYAKEINNEEDDGTQLTISNVKITRNGSKVLTTADQEIEEDDGKYYLNIPTGSGNDTYAFEYTYKNGENYPTKTCTIQVTEDFVTPTADNLKISIPSATLSLGANVELKAPSVSYANFDSALVDGVSYNVTKIEIRKKGNTNIKYTINDPNSYSFKMTKELFGATSYDDMLGNYEVEYTIKDVYGNVKSQKISVDGVKITKKPAVYMTYDYDATYDSGTHKLSLGSDVTKDTINKNFEYDFRKTYGSSEIVLPAAFATDDITDFSDLMIVRTLVKSDGTIYYVDNVKVSGGQLVNISSTDHGNANAEVTGIDNYQPNKTVVFTFEDGETPNGEYTLRYYAVSKEITDSTRYGYLYKSGTVEYTFTVDGTTTTNKTTPTVKFEKIANSLAIDETKTIKISSSDADDSKLKNALFFYYTKVDAQNSETSTGTFETDLNNAISAILDSASYEIKGRSCHILDDKTALETIMQNKGWLGFTIVSADENNERSFELALDNYADTKTANALADMSKVSVVAVAMNNYGKVSLATRTLAINDVAEEVPPVYTDIYYEADFDTTLGANEVSLTDNMLAYTDKVNQNVRVYLPKVKFTEDSIMSTSVRYYIDTRSDATDRLDPTYLFTDNYNYYKTTGGCVVDGGSIVTSAFGTYYVVYTATDYAGNSATVYFTFQVKDSSTPILYVTADAMNDIEISQSGNTITAEEGAEIGFSVEMHSSSNNADVTEDATIESPILTGSGYTGADNVYRFDQAGDYTITFAGKYNDVQAENRTINIKITKAKLDWTNEGSVQEYASAGETVNIPVLTAKQGTEPATVKVEIKDKDGNDVAIDKTGAQWSFDVDSTENYSGVYSITYTATSASDTITKSFTVKVGDNVPPTVQVSRKADLQKDIVFDGVNKIEYNIDVNNSTSNRSVVITISSNGKEIYSRNIGLTLADKNDADVSTAVSYLWSNLDITLTGENVTDGAEEGEYFINGTGKCTLTIKTADKTANDSIPYEISFNVVEKARAKDKAENAGGIALLVISLVFLAGVITYFAVTGKKGGSSKSNKEKRFVPSQDEINEEKPQDAVVENNDEPKSGDVE